MSTHKYFNQICCVVLALTLALTALFMNAEHFGVQAASAEMGYESRLFDASSVHTIDIIMDDWDAFIASCTDEEYVVCSVIIDGETYRNVAIRAKGNTSLTQVASYGNDRYSFKIEFDHYDSGKTYHGLDKLSLNNIIQDNTYMKDFLTYQMMNAFGVSAPLCSYVQIFVNGEEWGLYLAVEGVEDAFLQRNYGSDAGELYKPDSMSMGGGRGNGGQFDMENWQNAKEAAPSETDADGSEDTSMPGEPGGFPNMEMTLEQIRSVVQSLDDETLSALAERLGYESADALQAALETSEDVDTFLNGTSPMELMDLFAQQRRGGMGDVPGGNGRSMGSSDVSLIYSDDNYESYSNIFENAKTDITDADKDRLIASLKQLNENSNIEDVVDVDAVLRYFVVHNFVCNFDSYTGSMIHNYYLYEEDGQLSMIPWDYNLAFGGFMGGSDATSYVNYPIDTPVSGGTVESRPMLSWIFESEEYTALYHQYFAEFIDEYFSSGTFEALIDSVKEMISPYVESDPTKFCTYEEFQTGIATLREFCLLRAQSIRGQLDGTIASTSEAQTSDTLVDASHLSISDMGAMNHGAGGGMAGRPDRQIRAVQMADTTSAALSESSVPQAPDGTGQSTEPFDSSSMPTGSMPAIPGGGVSMTPPTGTATPLESTEGEGWTAEQEATTPEAPSQDNARTPFQGEAPASSKDDWALILASAAVLLAGLAFAWLYRKRA